MSLRARDRWTGSSWPKAHHKLCGLAPSKDTLHMDRHGVSPTVLIRALSSMYFSNVYPVQTSTRASQPSCTSKDTATQKLKALISTNVAPFTPN